MITIIGAGPAGISCALYLKRAKHLLNSDLNQNDIFEEYINGPMEEPVLIAFDVDINKFIKYEKLLKEKRNK